MGANPNDPRAPYLQVAAAIREDIKAGVYQAGQKLPAVRELMAAHKRAQGTIDKAIDVLRREGRVVTHPGSGIYVADPNHPMPPDSVATAEEVAALRDDVTDLQRRIAALEHPPH